MTQARLPFLMALALAVSGAAYAQAPSEEGVEARDADRLSEDFRDFVDDAIGEGLLTPTRQQPVQKIRGRLEAEETDIAVPSIDPDITTVDGCGVDSALDLQQFAHFETYEDFLVWRASRGAGEGALPADERALALISIGLYAEARLELAEETNKTSRFLTRLSSFLEDGRVVDIQAFEDGSDCVGGGEVWTALARLSAADAEGADRLNDNLMVFRRLPFRLKVRSAAIAVPALDRMERVLIAEKIMADFTAEDVQRFPQLGFSRAVLDMRGGSAHRDQALRKFLNSPELGREAAAVLVRHGFDVDATVREDMVVDMMDTVQSLSRGADVRASLNAMLNGPGSLADYETIARLSALPALQEQETQTLLASQLVARLEKDFEAEDRLANVAAMSAAVLNRHLLSSDPDRDTVLNSATDVAVTLGLSNVAEILVPDVRRDAELMADRAALAFRMYDVAALRDMSGVAQDNQQVMRLAAMSAIMTQDTGWLDRIAGKVALDAQTLADLIECDAAYGNWVLPEKVYAAAAKVTDEAIRPRIDRVLTLRKHSSTPAPRTIALKDIPESLQKISALLDETLMEAP